MTSNKQNNISEDIRRVLEAKEIVCPSIVLSIREGDYYCGTFVLDYILEDFSAPAEAIQEYILNMNKSGRVRGYGSDIFLTENISDLKVWYYFDVSSYLFDPIKKTPSLTTASCFKEYKTLEGTNLKIILKQFLDYLLSGEIETEIFSKGEFSTEEYLNNIFERNEHLSSFFDVHDTNYFNKSLF